MKECIVRNVIIGDGKPKVCIPIVGKNDNEIINQANKLKDKKFDILELRIDFYQDILNKERLLNVLKCLKNIINQPILFTYRSLKEGGQIQLTDSQYKELVKSVCSSDYVDLIDIELDSGNRLVYQLVEIAHNNNVKIIMSSHNFDKTPDNDEMIDKLERMEAFGADICKIAVMPLNKQDVLRLLEVTSIMSKRLNTPIVTMSMSSLGIISRIAGETFGSAMTFACYELSSAPGQINVDDMNYILEVLHND